MSLTEDLRGKVEAAMGRLVSLAERLDEIESLEQSLREANGGLAQVSANISELAGSARTAHESLDATLKALERAADALVRLDPGTISSAIEATNTSMKVAIADSSKELSGHVSEQAQAITQVVSTNHDATQQQLREQAAQQAERRANDVKVFKWIGSLLLTLLIILVILAVLIFINIQ